MRIVGMSSQVTLCFWITALLLLCQVHLGRAEDRQLWCLQCSWSNTAVFSTLNGTNGTSDPNCLTADLSHLSNINPPSPIVNPLCTYDPDNYEELLEGPCYDAACYAQGKSCIKWTMTMDGLLVNITRLCAMVGSDTGCYTQSRDGYDEEVCICTDQQYCNGADNLHITSPYRLLTFQMFTLVVVAYWLQREF